MDRLDKLRAGFRVFSGCMANTHIVVMITLIPVRREDWKQFLGIISKVTIVVVAKDRKIIIMKNEKTQYSKIERKYQILCISHNHRKSIKLNLYLIEIAMFDYN